MKDRDIIAEYPEIRVKVERGYRWLPLRLALHEFGARGYDKVSMTHNGLQIHHAEKNYWVLWSEQEIVELRNKGLYAKTLLNYLLCTKAKKINLY